MGLTLQDIRIDVGKDLHECITGSVDSASPESVTDADLIDQDADDTMYDRAWLRVYRTTNTGVLYDETRRLRGSNSGQGRSGYSPDVGALHVSRPFTVVPAAGANYELHTLIAPSEWDRHIDNGLARCFYMFQQPITVVDGQRIYDLSAYTWLNDPDAVVNVYAERDSTDINEARKRALRWFAVDRDPTANTVRLHVRPEILSAADDILVIRAYRSYGGGAWTAAGTDCPAEWVKSAARMEAYRSLSALGTPAQDNKRYLSALHEESIGFAALCNHYMPHEARPVMFSETPR